MSGDVVWEPANKWRVVTPDGRERSKPCSRAEALIILRPGDTLQRLHVARAERWQEVKP